MKRIISLIALFGFGAAATYAAAQVAIDDTGLDLAAIRARAAEQAEEAEALARTVRTRGEAVAADAQATMHGSQTNAAGYAREAAGATQPNKDQPFDFDRLVADTGQMAEANLGSAARFIGFASTSMPPEALRQMMHDVTTAGGVVVLRGLPKGSAKELTAALAKVLAPGERMDGVGIDPRLFRAFEVDAVPAYVMTSSDFDLCDGFDCTSDVPAHDRITGNVTAAYALETFARGGGPGARLAVLHLANLRKVAP